MQILYEDNHLIAVNKPFCMPAQGDSSRDESVFDWVKEYIRTTYNKPGNVYLALLHRLDRVTGGVMVLGKTSKAAARVSKQFQLSKINKTYLAITERVPNQPAQVLSHHLRKHPKKNIMRAYDKPVTGSKASELRYELLHKKGARALLQVFPKTGRQHQIRVQLSRINCTIKGDVKYGDTPFNADKSIALFAHKIELTHPTTKEPLHIQAPYPKSKVWDEFRPHFS